MGIAALLRIIYVKKHAHPMYLHMLRPLFLPFSQRRVYGVLCTVHGTVRAACKTRTRPPTQFKWDVPYFFDGPCLYSNNFIHESECLVFENGLEKRSKCERVPFICPLLHVYN